MYKRVKIKKLGRTKTHRASLIRNQIRSLFTTGKVETTTPKAKVLKEETLRILGRFNRNSNKLTKVREMESYFGTSKALAKVKEFMTDAKNNVSIVKTRFREGDNAEMSLVTLVGFQPDKKKVSRVTAQRAKPKKVEEKPDQPKPDKPERPSGTPRKESLGNKIAKSLKTTFSGSKERARSRSGL